MSDRTMLVTGGNGFIGKKILAHYLDQDMTIVLLTQDKFAAETEALIQRWSSQEGVTAKFKSVLGDITQAGLGLSIDDFDELKETVTDAIHLAAAYNLGIAKAPAELINVQGTRNTMEVLAEMKNFKRLGYISTTAIAGDYIGEFTEDDFNKGQGFKNFYESTKFKAEAIVREYMDDIPTVIFRPTIVVGDSNTGEIEKIDGPYYAFVMISRNLHVAMSQMGETKCHIAPVNYVTDALHAIFENDTAPGGCYHLGDSSPMLYKDFIDLACERWGKFKPLVRLPAPLMYAMLHVPAVESIFGVLKESFPYTYLELEYTFDHAEKMLEGTGIRCPQVPEYMDVMIDYFVNHLNKRGLKKSRW